MHPTVPPRASRVPAAQAQSSRSSRLCAPLHALRLAGCAYLINAAYVLAAEVDDLIARGTNDRRHCDYPRAVGRVQRRGLRMNAHSGNHTYAVESRHSMK